MAIFMILAFLLIFSGAYAKKLGRGNGKRSSNYDSSPNKDVSKTVFPSSSLSKDTYQSHRIDRKTRKIDPFDYNIELDSTTDDYTYSYDDQDYFSYDPGNFDDDLPRCYYPTPTSYVDLKYCYGHQTRNLPPPCITDKDLVYNNRTGGFSADQTFYNCMANIPDVASMPTFFNGKYHGCLLLLTQVTLLNLVRVDEVEGLVELQVIIDYSWIDRRYNMPEFWEHIKFSYSGFDITAMLKNDSIVMWTPTIVFPDAQSISIMAETLTVLPTHKPNISSFFYEVTYCLVLVQPGFNFKKYPNDDQNLVIRYSALNFDAEQLQLFPSNIACSYLPGGTCSFASNSMWIWKNEPSFQSCTAYPDQKASMIYPAYVYYGVKLVRQGNGIIVRLILPLMFLLLLSALTFWVSHDSRVDTTVTLLLSVSALYIIILQSIPLVGYLTAIDKFVFWMFLLLCAVVSLHQVYATLYEKTDKWPLRLVYMRVIELVGRCFLPPVIVFYFLKTIEFGSETLRNAIMSIVVIGITGLFIAELFGVRASYYHAMEFLVMKANQRDIKIKDLSWLEIIMLNRYLFGTWSYSLAEIASEISKKGELHFEKPTSVTLVNMNSLSSFMGEPKRVDMQGRMPGTIDATNAKRAKKQTSVEMSRIPSRTASTADVETVMTHDDFRASLDAFASSPLHAYPAAAAATNNNNNNDNNSAARTSYVQNMNIDSDDEN